MNCKETTQSSQYLYKGKILNLRKDQVLLPDGNRAIREIVEHSGGAAVVCIEKGKMLIVKQFRYPYKKEVWEIPAGKINNGETPDHTARRELEEEGGIIAKTLTKIFEIYPTPGYTEEIIHLYYASDLQKTCNRLDDDEFLEAEWIDITTLKEKMEKGELKDAKTLIALMWVLNNKVD